MLFNQIEFIVFFVLTIIVLLIFKRNTTQKIIILSASYYFYSYWDYRFIGLILFPTIVDFSIGKLLQEYDNPLLRKLLLIVSLIINLGILGLFKYFNFFLSSIQSLLIQFNFNVSTLNVILPLGISFYTFRVLSYTIDVYNRKIEPCNNILDFAIFISFFPLIIAGPIVRAASFLPQFNKPIVISWNNCLAGFRLFVIGLFFKVFIADGLAMFVNYFFENHTVFDSLTSWLAVIAYSLQIYYDFAGYSSIAIGIALIIGFKIDENFNFPYLATSIKDFWRRWHITLSLWIRDYVYIPLGGNRKGKIRTYLNSLIAMTLCGLWHGAAWTFVLWGFYHGMALVVNNIWAKHKINKTTFDSSLVAFINWALTLVVVIIGWVFFRSTDFTQAISVLAQLFVYKKGITWYQPFVIFIILATTVHHISKVFKMELSELPLGAWYTPSFLFSFIWLVIVYYPKEFMPFVYLQF